MANSGIRQNANAEWHESFHPTKLRINKNRPTLIMMQGLTTKAVLPSNVDSYLYCYWCWLGDIRTITPFVQHRQMFISSKPELQSQLFPQQCTMCVSIIFWLLAVKSISQWSCVARKGWVEGGGSKQNGICNTWTYSIKGQNLPWVTQRFKSDTIRPIESSKQQ